MKYISWLSIFKYIGIVLIGSGLLALLRTTLFTNDHFLAHTINDAIHVLWGMILAWAWVFLVHRGMLDEAREHLEASRALLERAGEMNRRVEQMAAGMSQPRRDIDLEI